MPIRIFICGFKFSYLDRSPLPDWCAQTTKKSYNAKGLFERDYVNCRNNWSLEGSTIFNFYC